MTEDDVPSQDGRTALVTGANSGLGRQVSRVLAQRGARVLMAARDRARGQAAVDEVRRAAPDAAVELVDLDLASLASVERAADDVVGRVDALDLLVNNAGIMMVPRRETEDGFERQLGTNHLGHFALTGRLLPLLRHSDAARVVTVSSLAANDGRVRFDDLMGERTYSRTGAYGQSKLANLLFTRGLDRRLRAAGAPVAALAAHPGIASTNLVQAPLASLPGPLARVATPVAQAVVRVLAQSDAQGAQALLMAATLPSAESGEYYGPTRLGGQRGAPARVDMPGQAHDDDAVERLWQVSEDLTGVGYEGLPARV